MVFLRIKIVFVNIHTKLSVNTEHKRKLRESVNNVSLFIEEDFLSRAEDLHAFGCFNNRH